MGDLEYPPSVSWDIDIAEEEYLPQNLLPGAAREIVASGSYYQPGQREFNLYQQVQPWIVPSTTYGRRMRHVSTPMRSASGVSKTPVDGLRIRVEKRKKSEGLAAQFPLPSYLSSTSPTARRPTNESIISTASSQSFAHEEVRSSVTSNGPITPNVSPIHTSPRRCGKSAMVDPVYSAEPDLSAGMGERTFDQTFMVPVTSYNDPQSRFWGPSNAFAQQATDYSLYPYGEPYQEPILYSTHDQDYNNQYFECRRSFTVPEQLRDVASKKPARKHFTPEVTNTLKTWFKENSHRPYPSEETKQELLRQTGLTMNQLSNWFINARRRNWRRTRLVRDG